ncbi:MAG: hypothetical protein ACREMO_00200 [Gemmatimonadales bacterium]
MVSELGSSQISTLLETLPGIANVLRSPVADALLNVIRAAARIGDFAEADADELIHYAVRRGLVGAEEGERVLADVQAARQRKLDKAADRDRAAKARDRSKAKVRPTVRPKAKGSSKTAKRKRR